MSRASASWFERYQAVRRPLEVAFWVLAIGLQGLLNTTVALVDVREAGLPVPTWHLVLWEASSHLVVLALIPALVAWERRFPLHWDTLRRHLPWHLLGSLLFSVVHVVLMVLLRKAGHALAGESYQFGGWLAQWGYEYLKDVRAYVLIVGTVAAYRFVLLRAQGEARVLDAPEPAASAAAPPPPDPPARPERFLVRKLRREFLIAATDIEWLQAQGNYVGLHVNGHDYLLRSTLTEFLAQLDPARFVRVHRSYVVNLDRIAEIEPLDGGDARLKMRGGSTVPCSRRYRDALTGPA